ncbi:sarcosine oxidase subunit gamma [Tropicibacter naphthalenivorans]|uniref:Sarcosine oxidase, gamma subunit family n=1 Tax=Tropicibacter naphthalenivorans TaxID=441103 RepID=A0A0P1GFV8_9RHOB|nr:sarcosine oxidase subunit gamma [Tropicibacter naphthalenivorans]CUH80703.1 sarcosine oxidase, gamma subunit family [Tropicibacter naphthalenivorans]SMC89442.1 sarcosine oxidase subunit gamma [Tropicibacter naphthalenivorans]
MNALTSFPQGQEPETLVSTAAVTVTQVPHRARLSLRARGDLAPLDRALGFALPRGIGGVTLGTACLGPDEWIILTDDAAAVMTACAEVSLPHSLVDVSGREITFEIEGPRASELLTLGCPRDIDAIPDGTARRTVFDGVTVTLWRDTAERFRIDVWNSFAPHVAHLLASGARELAAEMA